MPRYLTPTLNFDRAAIMRAAWFRARYYARLAGTTMGPFKARATTARAEFPAALREVWDAAKAERDMAVWRTEREAGAAAESARRAALPVRALQIEDARVALMFAEHNDTVSGHRSVAEARARLRTLQLAA